MLSWLAEWFFHADAQIGLGTSSTSKPRGSQKYQVGAIHYHAGSESAWDDDGLLQMADGGPTHDEHATLLGEDARGQPQNAAGAAALKLG